MGRAYEQKGRLAEAIVEFQRAVELEKDNAETWSGLAHAYAVSGKRAEAQKILDHLKEISAHSWVAPYNVAVIMRAWETKIAHSPCLNKPTKTGPTICLPIWRPTLAWIACAPIRALGNFTGASDYLSDASFWLRPSVVVRVVGRWSANRKSSEVQPACSLINWC